MDFVILLVEVFWFINGFWMVYVQGALVYQRSSDGVLAVGISLSTVFDQFVYKVYLFIAKRDMNTLL